MPYVPCKAKRIMCSSVGQSILDTENALTQADSMVEAATASKGAAPDVQAHGLSQLILIDLTVSRLP